MNRGDVAIRLSGVGIDFAPPRHMRRRSHTALKSIDLDLNHGERLGVIGRNGAGKSTLLRILSGVLEPDFGVVERNHGACQLLTLGIGFTPQLSGRENAIMSGLLMGFRKRDFADRLDDIRDFAELDDFFEMPINTYSAGMRARLGFAIAMQLRPDILLLDEMLGVGDAEFKQKSKAAVFQMVEEAGSVVIVSHQESTLRDLCSRTIWIDSGSTRLIGETDDVLKEYSDVLGTRLNRKRTNVMGRG